MRNLYLLILLTFLSSHVLSQAIDWNRRGESINIGRQVYLLREDKPLSINEVSSPAYRRQFTKSDQAILNFGFSESVYWIKFTVTNTTNDPLLLEVAQATLPAVSFFYKDSTGRWKSYQAGYTIPLRKKQIKHHFQLFPLTQKGTDYFLRVQSVGSPIPIAIWNENLYETQILYQLITYGIYMGMLVFVILNNLFFFFSLRRVIYLQYTILVFLYAFFSALYDGYILYVFPSTDLLTWYIINPIINQPNGLLYSIFFLEAWKYTPKLYRLSLFVAGYFTSYVIWHFFLPLSVVLPLNQLHALVGILLMTFLGFSVSIRGNKLGYYFAAAYCLFFIIATVEIVYLQTGRPIYFFALSHVSIGIFIEVFMLAYALSKRFEWEQNDAIKAKTEAQQQLLEKTQENEQLLLVQNETLENEVTERTRDIAHKSLELQQSLDHLKTTQIQLIQKEKMASLGELTAGIAHEIQNPLNFVNNFSELSVDMLDELADELAANHKDNALALAEELANNLKKITHHGERASSIVHNMLEHSRASTGQREPTDLNALCDNYLRLTYNGLRAKDKSYAASYTQNLDPELSPLNVAAQDISRVLMNLFNNAFYAVRQKQLSGTAGPNYQPIVSVATRSLPNGVEIRVHDNGTGIPVDLQAKIFQPFFTTKPSGSGTGLGLSLSYDIITKGHGGTLEVESEEQKGTTFTIMLPG